MTPLRIDAQVEIVLHFVIVVVLSLQGLNLFLDILNFLHRLLDMILLILNLDQIVDLFFEVSLADSKGKVFGARTLRCG